MSESENETVREQLPSEEQTLPERPGRRLREAREAKNLSRENVATELRLQVRLVTALEEDDDSDLPPPAFVIGYLRSYARRLELPADEIVRAYEQNLEGHQPKIVSRVKNSQVSSRDLPVRMVTWLILLGLIALLVAWWLSQQPLQLGSTVEPEASSTELVPESTPVFSSRETESLPAPQEPTSDTVPPEPQAPVSNAEESTPEVQPQAVQAVSSEPEPENVAPEGVSGASLRIVFEADSWTEVTDAEGQRLVYDLVKAGRTLRFVGKPPFRVFLGYAPGVTVYYQGERFDHTPYMRRDIARFSLGSSEDVQSGGH